MPPPQTTSMNAILDLRSWCLVDAVFRTRETLLEPGSSAGKQRRQESTHVIPFHPPPQSILNSICSILFLSCSSLFSLSLMFQQTPVDYREDAGNLIIQNNCLFTTNIQIFKIRLGRSEVTFWKYQKIHNYPNYSCSSNT